MPSGEHRTDSLLGDVVPELGHIRARNRDGLGPSLVKASVSWAELCKRRAQADYLQAVQVSGGYKQTGNREGHDESTVRARCHDPRLDVHLKHVYSGLSRDGLYALANAIMNFADETESRRVG